MASRSLLLCKPSSPLWSILNYLNETINETEYSQGSDYARLPVIEDYDYLRHIRVPKGIYVSSKGLQMSSDSYIDDEDDYSLSSSPQSPTLYKPAYVPSTTYHQPHKSSYPVHEHSGYPMAANPAVGPTYSSNGGNAADAYISGYSYPSHSKYGPSKSSENKAYVPLTSEDRRALGAFRVALWSSPFPWGLFCFRLQIARIWVYNLYLLFFCFFFAISRPLRLLICNYKLLMLWYINRGSFTVRRPSDGKEIYFGSNYIWSFALRYARPKSEKRRLFG